MHRKEKNQAHKCRVFVHEYKKMSLTVNCFQGLKIKELFCNCCAKKKPEEKEDEGTFENKIQQIVVLATPQIDFPELIVYEDLKLSDIVIFSNNDDNETLFTSVSGTTLLKAIQAAAPPPTNADRIANEDGEEVKNSTSPKTSTPRGRLRAGSNNNTTPSNDVWVPTHPDDLCGKKAADVLPEYLKKFFLPLYRQTLQGNYLQLTILWLGNTQLLRTFPLMNHKKQVIGGMAVTSPYNTDFAGDISRFTLNAPERQKM